MAGPRPESPEPRRARAGEEGEGAGAEAAAAADRGSEPGGASEARELSRCLLDPEFMLEVFRRELPAASAVPLALRACSVKQAKTVASRKAVREGRQELVYRLELELPDGGSREVVLCGLAPVGPDFPGPALEQRCRELREHPSAAPFRRLALRLEALPLGLLLFPLDPALPALAELTGADAPRLLAPHLPECRAGARIARCEHELRHYKPLERAVLRVRVEFVPSPAAPGPRTVYVKLFDDDHGARSHADLRALWTAALAAPDLRVPEPLGYAPEQRMLVLSEVPGGRALSEWIHCLEHELPLPEGVSRARVEQAVRAAARALVALQRSGVQPAARRSFEDAMASLAKDRALLVAGEHAAEPALVTRALALVARLAACAPRAEPLVPSHGGARHKQTIGDEHGLTFIDWDGFCRANPALDAATFLARLRLEPLTNPGRAPELERLAALFRDELLAGAPEAGRDLALYEGLVLTEQVLRSFRRRTREAEGDSAARLAGAAEACLADLARA